MLEYRQIKFVVKMNGEDIYVCITKNEHSLPRAILTQLQQDLISSGNKVVEIENDLIHFKNDEQKPVLKNSVRRKEIFLIWTIERHIDIEIMKLMFYIDALHRNGADHITVIMPFFAYGRQDKTVDREPNSASLLARIYQFIGAKHFVTVHLHNDAIEGFFHAQVDRIGTKKLFWDALKEYYIKQYGQFDPTEWMIVSPDEGATKQGRDFAKRVGTGHGSFSKHRTKPNVVESMEFFGNCAGKNVLVYDDMMDTGGTAVKACEKLVNEYKAKKVFMAASHPLLNGNAPEILQSSSFEKVFVTDSLHIPPSKQFEKLVVVSLASTLAQVIHKIKKGESIKYEGLSW